MNKPGENLDNVGKPLEMTPDLLQEEARRLARQLFGDKADKVASFTNRILDICVRARDKDFLLLWHQGKNNGRGTGVYHPAY